MIVYCQMLLKFNYLDALPSRLVRPILRWFSFRRLSIGVEHDFVEFLKDADEHERGFVVCELNHQKQAKFGM